MRKFNQRLLNSDLKLTFAFALVLSLVASPTWAGTVSLGKHEPSEIFKVCPKTSVRITKFSEHEPD